MRRNPMTTLTALIAVILAVLIAFSGVMCLQDAFSLDCQPVQLLVVCTLSAVVTVLLMLLRRSRLWNLLAVLLLAAVLLWQRGAVADAWNTVLWKVTAEYAQAFSPFPRMGELSGSGFWILMPIAVFLAWLTVRVIVWEGSVVLVVLAVLPVLLLCLLVVDLAPVLWLILLTGGMLVLLLSQNVRERSASEGGRLAWWLMLPTVILICVITTLWPPADYVRSDWSDTLQHIAEAKVNVQTVREQVFASRPRWNRELRIVDLSQLGPKILTGIAVLDYKSESNISYLRGVSLGVYENNRWEAVDSDNFGDHSAGGYLQIADTQQQYTLQLRTKTAHPQMYTAYDLAELPLRGETVDDAYIWNVDRLTEYAVTYGTRRQGAAGLSASEEAQIAAIYTRIPADLQAPLAEILENNGLTGGTAEAVAQYVRQMGKYDLNTPAVPAGEDFVLYFLQNSHRGYCVHFATSTVMLLRAAGIPARYVTGYAVSGGQNRWNTVTEDDAHAWVEYYVSGEGWVALDPTPAAETQQSDASSPAQPGTQAPEEREPAVDQEQSLQKDPPEIQMPSEKQDQPQTNLLWLLWLPLLPVAVLLRYWFGIRLRRERLRKGHPNRRALMWWRWLVQLHKASGEPVPEELIALAQKAKFSQHTITEEELQLLCQAADGQTAALRSLPAGQKLWHRFGLVLY